MQVVMSADWAILIFFIPSHLLPSKAFATLLHLTPGPRRAVVCKIFWGSTLAFLGTTAGLLIFSLGFLLQYLVYSRR